MAGLDPDATGDPLVAGVDHGRQVVVGEHLGGLIVAERHDT
jgi:hypothetical protein